MKSNLEVEIFYHPYTQFDNLGDLIINRMLISDLKTRGALHVLSHAVPASFLEGLHVERSHVIESPWRFWFELAVKRLVHGRKCYLFTKPGDIALAPKACAHPSTVIKAVAFGVLKVIGVNICAAGISVDVDFRRIKPCEAYMARRFLIRAARDKRSAHLIKEMGAQASIGADLGFLVGQSSRQVQVIRRIGLSFRSDAKGISLMEAALLLSDLRSNPAISLHALYQVDRDRDFMEKLAEHLGIAKPVAVSDDLSAYSDIDAVISNRLHVLVFGMSRGAVPIAILKECNQKVRSLLQDIGLDACILPSGRALTVADLSLAMASGFATVFAREARRAGRMLDQVFAKSV